MKKRSLKIAILGPSLAMLIIGITALAVVVGVISSKTAKNLTYEVLDARIRQYTNEFNAFSGEVYGALSATAAIIENYTEPDYLEHSLDPRADVVHVLTDTLFSNDKLTGVWTVWEPDAFDGKDEQYANTPYHDGTGRFVPYIFQEGSSFHVEALTSYEDPVDGDYYLGARNSGKPYATDPYPYVVNGREVYIYSIAMPILQNNKVLGVVGMDIDLNEISTVMNSGHVLNDGYLFTLSPGGIITTHSNWDYVMSRYDSTWMSKYSTQIESVLKNGGGFSFNAYPDGSGDGIVFLGNSIQIGDITRNWLICEVIPEKTVNESSVSLIWTIAAIGLLIIAVTGVTIFLIIRGALVKLPKLKAAAEAISVGDADSSGLDNESSPTKNEITLLERAFVKMTAGIKEEAEVMSRIAEGDYAVSVENRSDKDLMSQAINQMLDNTNNTLNNISNSAGQVSMGSKQIADGAQALAQGSTEQAASIEELSGSITDIARKTKENAETAEKTSRLSVEIRENAEKGNRQMNEMITAVKEINEASKNISKIIKTIDDIAFQTNILALNAAVEAARAGQHGKGFAVVAEEVRNLASKSAEAAKDTGDMIKNSMEKAEFGYRIAGETAESLRDIVVGINESTALVSEIAKASDEQSFGISQINTGIDQVAQVIQMNSATAEESAAASQTMSGQSEILQKLISQFHLKGGGAETRSRLPYNRT